MTKGLLSSENTDRVDISAFVKLSRRIAGALDDEMAGLLERPQRVGTFAIITSYASLADTVEGAMERLAHAYDLTSNSLRTDFVTRGVRRRLVVERRPGMLVRNTLPIESVLVLTHRFCSWLANRWIPIRQVDFDFPQPHQDVSYKYLFPDAQVRYDQPVNSLTFASAALSRPVLRNHEQATGWGMRAPLDAYLPIEVMSGLAEDVAQVLEENLLGHTPLVGMEEVADALSIKPHTLRRRLKELGTSYIDIRNQVRRDAAIHLVNTTTDSLGVIAENLGFSEASAFVRAFKSWTGYTPRAYRASGRSPEKSNQQHAAN
ncbi:MAG: AraC family transcriptional regulator ligand-binding domain-containing protein [Parvularculaceae bacterium]|nr:AraC family transcriptional regulator ligand-binding domain-containing protein [Parvularculaceae bacterium]